MAPPQTALHNPGRRLPLPWRLLAVDYQIEDLLIAVLIAVLILIIVVPILSEIHRMLLATVKVECKFCGSDCANS